MLQIVVPDILNVTPVANCGYSTDSTYSCLHSICFIAEALIPFNMSSSRDRYKVPRVFRSDAEKRKNTKEQAEKMHNYKCKNTADD